MSVGEIHKVLSMQAAGDREGAAQEAPGRCGWAGGGAHHHQQQDPILCRGGLPEAAAERGAQV